MEEILNLRSENNGLYQKITAYIKKIQNQDNLMDDLHRDIMANDDGKDITEYVYPDELLHLRKRVAYLISSKKKLQAELNERDEFIEEVNKRLEEHKYHSKIIQDSGIDDIYHNIYCRISWLLGVEITHSCCLKKEEPPIISIITEEDRIQGYRRLPNDFIIENVPHDYC